MFDRFSSSERRARAELRREAEAVAAAAHTSSALRDAVAVLLDLAPPEERESIVGLLRPLAAGRQSAEPGSTDSYVGGHPYLPPGQVWPLDEDGRAMHFVVQVDFAAVPELPGFPREGLLQLFVRDHETWGLTGETGEPGAFHCRWYDASALDASSSPGPATPVAGQTWERRRSPVRVDEPFGLGFDRLEILPSPYEHLAPDLRESPRGFAALDTLWEEHEELAADTLDGWDVWIGGWPSFVQGAPAVPPGCSAQLIMGLGSSGLMMWGDVGTAHLFGDPQALARGDLGGLWWEWAN